MRPAVSDLAEKGRHATGEAQLRAAELAERARERLAEIPTTMVGLLRRRMNLLDLATRHDIELQSRLGRDRVSYVLKEFLEAQRGHDEALRVSLRSELREELQTLATAAGDGAFAIDESMAPMAARRARSYHSDLDYDLDDDDDLDDDEDDDDLESDAFDDGDLIDLQ